MRRLVFILVLACCDQSRTPDAGTESGGGFAPGLDAGVRPPPKGVVRLEACRGLNGVNEDCAMVTDASACANAKCKKLVAIFSGGEQGCETGAGYAGALKGFAAKGYAAVCLNYFETSTGTGAVPYVDEAPRIDLILKAATLGDWAKTYWSGEYLLLEGISHGATAPVMAMARTSLDNAAHWKGTFATGACFFDGAYDVVTSSNLLKTGGVNGKPCTFPVSYSRGLERYCGPGATDATCTLSTQPKAKEDSISQVNPIEFAIQKWRLIECGSALPVCSADIIPAAPIQALCQNIDASPAHECTFAALPNESHLTCHADFFDTCRSWFEAAFP
jgi:hypothetical protein